MKSPLFSVIIPVYNLEKEIAATIESVCTQNYKDLQIILVNDGSSDNSLDICMEYAGKDKRMIVIDKKNEGLPMARKSGLELATGDYIHHLDGGDTVEPGIYGTLAETISNNNCPDIVFFPFRYIYKDHTSESAKYTEHIKSPKDMLSHIWTTQQYNAVWQYIHKRELASGIKFDKSLTLCEDLYYTSQLLMSSESIYISNRAYLNYMINDDSMTHKTMSDKGVNSLKTAFKLVRECAEEANLSATMDFELWALKLQTLSTIILGGRLEDIADMAEEFNEGFRKYPKLKKTGVVKCVYKLINAYSGCRPLYRIILWNYIRKGKIKSVSR